VSTGGRVDVETGANFLEDQVENPLVKMYRYWGVWECEGHELLQERRVHGQNQSPHGSVER
jgi:hypothetical protein